MKSPLIPSSANCCSLVEWQKAQPITGEAGYVLVACLVVPGFDFTDFEMNEAKAVG
jgi:predicted cupin superfamily sugar epimerase